MSSALTLECYECSGSGVRMYMVARFCIWQFMIHGCESCAVVITDQASISFPNVIGSNNWRDDLQEHEHVPYSGAGQRCCKDLLRFTVEARTFASNVALVLSQVCSKAWLDNEILWQVFKTENFKFRHSPIVDVYVQVGVHFFETIFVVSIFGFWSGCVI